MMSAGDVCAGNSRPMKKVEPWLICFAVDAERQRATESTLAKTISGFGILAIGEVELQFESAPLKPGEMDCICALGILEEHRKLCEIDEALQ